MHHKQRFMAGQTMKKGCVVVLRKEYIFLMDVNRDFIPLGILAEDCYMGEIVEVIMIAE